MMIFAITMAVMGGSDKSSDNVSETSRPEPIVFTVERDTDASPISTSSDEMTETPSAPELSAPAPSIDSAIEGAADQVESPLGFIPDPSKHYISIIIDDIGNSSKLGSRAIELPGEMTFAILPHTPFGAELAELAYTLKKEIMLHAPMSNQAQLPLGPGALTPELNKDEFMKILNASIDAIPHLQGINNHMGSALTELELPMQWVMEVLHSRNLYFVDSRTTAGSVAAKVAKANNIPSITRNVFLDNETTIEDIDIEFKRLVKQAEEHGSAVGIGHPYAETLEYLEHAIPALAEQNIELIFASKMIQLRAQPAKQ
jgi:polysaccharide deacetylase 2 family uncharacterized protein YibQ